MSNGTPFKLAVISGGTATNDLVPVFDKLSSGISYILPISDNGGSTSELLRVIGGPAIGDLRSRLTRLIPDESAGLRDLLSHRLPKDAQLAKLEWSNIVDGSHELWGNIDPPVREIVRSYLIHFHTELLKRSRNSTKNFRLQLASVGNLLLTGVRLFCGSLDSAVELILRIARVRSTVEVLPCLNTNFTYHISALLENGDIITGQSQISHPSKELVPKVPITKKNGSRIIPSSGLPADVEKLHAIPVNGVEDLAAELGSALSVRKETHVHPPPIAASPPASEQLESFKNLYRQNSVKSTRVNRHFKGPSFDKIDSQKVIYGTTEIMRNEEEEDEEEEEKEEVNENEEDDYYHDDDEEENEYEYAIPSYTHPELKKSQLYFSKDVDEPLAAPIERIFYISPYGEEIYPVAQSRVVNCLASANCVVYSIGSLMTSLLPVLILRGVGDAILQESIDEQGKGKKKVLLLNGCLDRETHSLTALGFLKCIQDALKYSILMKNKTHKEITLNYLNSIQISQFVSHLFYIQDSQNIVVEIEEIEKLGIKCIPIKSQDKEIYADRYDFEDLYVNLEYIIKN